LEFLYFVKQFGIVLEDSFKITSGLYVVNQFGIGLDQTEGGISDFFLFSPDFSGGLKVTEHLSAPHTRLFVGRVLSGTTGTFNSVPICRFSQFNVLPLKASVLGFGVFPEPSDIPGNSLTSAFSALSLFYQGGIGVPFLR